METDNKEKLSLTKKQKEILSKLYQGYETTNSDRNGVTIIWKGNDSGFIFSKSTNQLILKGIIDSVHVGNNSSGYILTEKGEYLAKSIINKNLPNE